MSNPIVLVPARKGSKRLKGKNRRLLGDRPLYRWTVDAALQAGIPSDSIYICTDDQDLIDEARCIPVRAFLQPHPLHRDDCRDIEWVTDALSRLDSDRSQGDQLALLLRPTSPFRSAETITRALEQWEACKHGVDSLRAMRPARETGWKQWVIEDYVLNDDCALNMNIDGEPMVLAVENCSTVVHEVYPTMRPLTTAAARKHLHSFPTQSLEDTYIQTAGLEAFTFDTIYRTGTIAGDHVGGFMVEGVEALDINDQRDWDEAERLVSTIPSDDFDGLVDVARRRYRGALNVLKDK